MLDNWEKTHDLLASLKAATPFEVELTPPLIALLLAEAPGFDRQPRQVVRNVSYAGDEGGIVCHIEPDDGGQRWSSPSLTFACAARSRSPPLCRATRSTA